MTRFDILYVAQYRIIYYNVLYIFHTAQWLSWLERRPVTAEVESSSLFWVVYGVLAQLGEHLPYKQRVIGSSPIGPIFAGVAELADAQDLKSCGTNLPYRFDSGLRHW